MSIGIGSGGRMVLLFWTRNCFQIKVNLRKGHSVMFLVNTGQVNYETIGQNSGWKLLRI